MCGRPRGRPASAHSQPRQPRGRLCSRESSGPGPHDPGERGTPAERGLVTRLASYRHYLPRISCPWWRPQASLYSQLPNSWWLFQRRVSEGSTNATSEGPPTQKRRPAAGGWLSALKARFLPRWGGREREQTDPTSNSTNVQKGLGSRVYSSLQSMLFLIPVCLLQPHVLLSRSHPQHWHFLQASRSVLPHEGREGYDQGSRPPREGGLGEPSPAEPAVGTCLLHRAW